MNPTADPAPTTSPLPWMIAHLPYARVLDWGDPAVTDGSLDLYLVGPERDPDGTDGLFWLTQGHDLISIPIEAMEQFVRAVIQAGVALGQR